VTTRITWNQGTGELRIGAASGALDLLPSTRRYRLVVHGLDDVSAELPDGTRVDALTAPLVAEFDAATADGAVVRLSGERRPSDNRVEARLHELLNAAQIEYRTKQDVWAVLQRESGAARRVAALQAMSLAPALYAAVCEVLLADA
jgi:hypothetical protein